MASTPILYGFNNSTYVRTVRIVLHEKAVAYDQVPLNVLEGEPRQPEHLARHPFGKVPVLDIDSLRILETDAICRYLEDTHPEPSVLPVTPADRARANMVMSLVNSYGYGALIGAAAQTLFPDFIGGANAEVHESCLADAEKLLKLVMEMKGDAPWLAGPVPSLADYVLGPVLTYSEMTSDWPRLAATPGLDEWWERLSAHPTFQATAPEVG